ncbi:MAG: site-specific integrase [Prevotella sp.]|nr:site-specific integrase [Prevotella sp.]
MAKIEKKSKENPKLEQRVLADGQISLYLEYYLGRQSEPVLDEFGNPVLYEGGEMAGTPKFKVKHIRRKENLNLYLIAKPRTPIERQQNKDTLALAEKIRFERQQKQLESESGYRLKKDTKIDFLVFFQEYLDAYTKKDVRMIQIALQRFKDFLRDTPEYTHYLRGIKPQQINNEMMEAFTEYLQSRSVGEGAKSLYQRFKKVYKACAVKCNINYQKPFLNADGKSITITIDEGAIVKDFLSPEEEKQLMATHYTGENPEIRNAFIFCLYTGMRFCDVKDLAFGNFDFANRLLTYEQNKTKGHSKQSKVTLPVTDTLLGLLGEQPEARDKSELVFTLPSHTMCLKALRRWTKRAGIDKHITWHCARHSFGTNMAATAAQKGFSIRVVQEMMGHSSLTYTQRYTRVVDEQKKQAMAELNKLMGGGE